jgi:hypothetical protein
MIRKANIKSRRFFIWGKGLGFASASFVRFVRTADLFKIQDRHKPFSKIGGNVVSEKVLFQGGENLCFLDSPRFWGKFSCCDPCHDAIFRPAFARSRFGFRGVLLGTVLFIHLVTHDCQTDTHSNKKSPAGLILLGEKVRIRTVSRCLC